MWVRRFRIRVRSLVNKRAEDEKLERELEFHLAELKAEHMSRGMTEREAEAAARRLFGSKAILAEECRDQRQTAWVEDFVQDLRFGARFFLRNPTFSVVATLTLALCIGINAAFLMTAYAIAFKPLPYPAPNRLVWLEYLSGLGPVTAVRQMAKHVDYAGFSANKEATVQFSSEAARVQAAQATWNLLRVLGVAPYRGRWFDSQEEYPGRNRVVVLSQRTWRNRFGGDPGAVGRALSINDQEYEVIGIMPDEFAFPSQDTELWIPVNLDSRNIGDMWGGNNLNGIGHLYAGATMLQANAELRPLVDQVRKMFPWRMPDAWGSDAHLNPLREAVTEQVRPKIIALAVAAFLLLLIGSVNVTNLLLAQGIKRNRELAMREALGAGRGRLVRQLMTESAVLIAAGSLLGLLIAVAIVRSLPAFLPADTPRIAEVTLNTSLLLAVASGAAVAVILFAISAFIQLRNPNRESLTTKAMTPSHGSSFLSLALIGGELAIGVALIIGAGLMGRTFVQLSSVKTGFETGGLISARVWFGRNACGNIERCWATIQEVGANVATQLGVDSVSWANTTPLTTDISAVAVIIEDHPRPVGAPAYVLWETSVTPSYFHQLGITLRKGRLFNDADRRGTEPVTVVSESTAKHFWPQGDPIGKRIRPYSETQWRTVVGVVSDVSSYSLKGFPEWIDGVEYEPLSQSLPLTRDGLELSMFVKLLERTPPSSFLEKLPSQFADIAVSHAAAMERVKSESVADQRSTTALLALFATLGLLLAVLGVHGVVSHRVGQRTREISIRLALGASVRSVIQMILMETIAIAAIGLVAGVLGATALTRFLQSLLFGVTSHDPITFVISPALLLIAAVTAALVPALTVSRLDPAITLRQE